MRLHAAASDRPAPPARTGLFAACCRALLGAAVTLATMAAVVAMVSTGAPARGLTALGSLPTKNHHGDGSTSSQSQTSEDDTQTNRGCTKVIHSLDELNGALESNGGRGGAICVQMNNQSVNNTGGGRPRARTTSAGP
jgi:hypothetical protein